MRTICYPEMTCVCELICLYFVVSRIVLIFVTSTVTLKSLSDTAGIAVRCGNKCIKVCEEINVLIRPLQLYI